MRTSPAVGRSRPSIMRMVVDLPAPLGPRKPVTMPGLTAKVRLSTATFSPYRLVSPSISIMRTTLGRGLGGCHPDRQTETDEGANNREDTTRPTPPEGNAGLERTAEYFSHAYRNRLPGLLSRHAPGD